LQDPQTPPTLLENIQAPDNVLPPSAPPAPPVEDPPWSIADVVLLGIVTFAAMAFCLLATVFAAQHWYYKQLTPMAVALKPMTSILAQAIAYVLFFVIIYIFLRWERNQPFLSAMRWNWPGNWGWTRYIFIGIALSLVLGLSEKVLPMPKHAPINDLFKTPLQALLLSIFSVTLGPWVEEFFFRGFMYPALARPLGRPASIVITAALFALPHAFQLGLAWAAVLLIFVVGVVLAIVRAATRSLAASVLVHMAYNATIAVTVYFFTDGYRHLEKLTE
jgi:membrane protease YdiL (CAAX protease family)